VSEPPRDPAGEAELEELGDDVIISQESGAHAPAPRVNVTTDHPTVMISEPPGGPAPVVLPPRHARRERSEQTVVIRDRKVLDKMRREMLKHQPKKQKKGGVGSVYLIGVAALAALVVGTLIAALIDSRSGSAAPAASTLPASLVVAAPAPSGSGESDTIDLDALPAPARGPERSEHP